MQSGVNSKYCIELRDPCVPFHRLFKVKSGEGAGGVYCNVYQEACLVCQMLTHKVLIYIEYRLQSRVWRLPNYWPRTPSPPSECVLLQHQRRGGTHSARRRAVRGWQVNISEDAGHWIGLIQYNPSTCSPCKYLDVGQVHVNHLMAVLRKNTLLDTQLGDKENRRVK